MADVIKVRPREIDKIVAFLCGCDSYKGVWFGGDPPKGERGNFWWRKHLRTAMHSARKVDVERVAKIIHPQAWEDKCWLARGCADQQQARRSALAKAHEIIAAMG